MKCTLLVSLSHMKTLEVLYGNPVGSVTQLEVPSGEIVQLPLE